MFTEYKTFKAMIAIKHIRHWFVVLLLSFTSSTVFAEDGSDLDGEETIYLTLPDMMDRVKSQNLQLLIQKESVIRALEQTYQARAALLPQFSGRAQQTRQKLSRDFTSEEFEASFNSFSARIDASLTIFDAQQYADYRLARLNQMIEQLDYKVATQDILDQAIMLYFTHLRDLRSVEITQGNLDREASLYDLAKELFDAGAAVKIDVTRAEVRMATERRNLMEAMTDVDNSMLQLKALLDIDLDKELRLDRSIIEGINAPPSLTRYGSLEVLTELRPELQGQEKLLRQAELTEKAAKWQRLPSIELFADWGFDSSEALDGDEGEAWLIGLRASIPIWEGGRIAAETREAKAVVRQNEYRMRDLRNSIEREFKFSLLEMESRYAQIEIASDEVRLGKDEVELARERYTEGLADNREVIDAQQRLAEAERSHLSSIYLYGLSRLAFARSIGSVEKVLD